MFWQFLRTGTRSPVGVATATEISTKFLLTISLPSMTELTTGYSWSARVAAFMKNDMNPSLIPYFLRKSSPSYWIKIKLLFSCWLLRTCPLLGKLLAMRMCFENPLTSEQLFASTLTWVHESLSFRLKKQGKEVGEGESALVYLLWVLIFELIWEPIESGQVWVYLQPLTLLFFLQASIQLLMAWRHQYQLRKGVFQQVRCLQEQRTV